MEFQLYLKRLLMIFIFYFGTAAVAYFFLYRTSFLKKNKLFARFENSLSARKQLVVSTIYMFGAAFLDTFFVTLAYANHTKFYLNVADWGWLYIIFVSVIYVIGFEIMFYFVHRLLHTDFLYKKVHYIHHLVKSPTVLSIYCFHPLEAFPFFIFHMIFVINVPIHPYSFILSSFVLHFGNIFGHLGSEFMTHKVFKKMPHLNTPTGHFIHHQFENFNFGYYFLTLDKVFNTYKSSAGLNLRKENEQ